MSTPQIDTVGPVVEAMQARSAVCRALCGGILEMRRKAKTYLPQRPREADKDWEARRDEAEFFPAFGTALDAYVGKPLGSPIVPDGAPAALEALLDNVDNAGRDLDSFARQELREALRDGIAFVVADYHVVPPGLTLAQERALGARPYLVRVPLENVVDFRGETLPDGRHRCTHFRYREVAQVQAGRWGVAHAERIRVLEPGLVEVWEKQATSAGDEWVMLPELSGPVAMTEVMVSAFVPDPEEWWQGEPPLEALAWLNVTHWQSSSYQRSILNVARVPLLAADEDKREDTTQPIEVGTKGLIVGFPGLGYVEHTGAAIGAGKEDIEALEDKMRRVAGQVLDAKVKTKGEAEIDSRDASSKLRAWVLTFQDHLNEVLYMMARWLKEPSGGTVSLDLDWDESEVGADLLTAWSTMREKGQISQGTHLKLLHKAEIVEDPDAEAVALESEGPQMMSLPTFTPPQKMAPPA
jgi:hypothetical protein